MKQLKLFIGYDIEHKGEPIQGQINIQNNQRNNDHLQIYFKVFLYLVAIIIEINQPRKGIIILEQAQEGQYSDQEPKFHIIMHLFQLQNLNQNNNFYRLCINFRSKLSRFQQMKRNIDQQLSNGNVKKFQQKILHILCLEKVFFYRQIQHLDQHIQQRISNLYEYEYNSFIQLYQTMGSNQKMNNQWQKSNLQSIFEFAPKMMDFWEGVCERSKFKL